MRKDILLALVFMLLAAAICSSFAIMGPAGLEAVAPAEPAVGETSADVPESPPEGASTFEAPLSDLVNTLPPSPDQPKADVVVRVKLPPAPNANCRPTDPDRVPTCDPNRPVILF